MKKQIAALVVLVLLPILVPTKSGIAFAQHIGTGPSDHTIVVSDNGIVYTWGRNDYGQLGNGTTVDSNVPVVVSTDGTPMAGKTITQVAAGYLHSIALDSDGGTVITWGDNEYGQLGNRTTTNSNVPVAVSTDGTPMAGKTITQVAAGFWHSIALASDGSVYTWGYNGYGQLGDGNDDNSNVPATVITSGVLSGKTIIQVAAGYYHSIALDSDGSVYTWGWNDFGQLGNGATTNSNVPVAVSTIGTPMAGKTITQVAAGENHSIALDSDGSVYTWGYNLYGQLGDSSITASNVPVVVSTIGTPMAGKTIIQVAAGDYHSIALASDGAVYAWGRNYEGELGNGIYTDSSVPVAVSTDGTPMAGKTIIQVAAGTNHSIALASDGTVYTWGLNISGQLGNGNNTASNVPVAVDQSFMGFLPVEDNPADRMPSKFELSQNYPNPFNPTTNIRYSIPEASHVSLKVYDVLGNEIAELVNEELSAGVYNSTFNAANLSSGIYFYTLRANNFTATKKLMLIK